MLKKNFQIFNEVNPNWKYILYFYMAKESSHCGATHSGYSVNPKAGSHLPHKDRLISELTGFIPVTRLSLLASLGEPSIFIKLSLLAW